MAEPKKIKQLIGNLKETLSSIGNDSTGAEPSDILNSVSISFRLLFITEFLHRGVIYNNNATQAVLNIDKIDPLKILSTVNDSAGKVLVDETNYPKPLLMATCAISGMMAEKCANVSEKLYRCKELLKDKVINSWLSTTNYTPEIKSAYEKAVNRCKDVQDDRFLSLLMLSNPSSENNQEDNILCLQRHMLAISRGYYTHAALKNPDVPQMWKRALDVCLKQHSLNENVQLPYEAYHIAEASELLKNLARIASSKGNIKRASELNMYRIESLLSHTSSSCDDIPHASPFLLVTSSDQKDKTEENIIQERLAEAQTCLGNIDYEKCNSEFPIMYEILSFRIYLTLENTKVNSLANTSYQKAKNRQLESTFSKKKKTPITLESHIKLAQKELLLEPDSRDVDKQADRLHSVLLSILSSQETSPSFSLEEEKTQILDAAFILLQTQLERLVHRAQEQSLQDKKRKTNLAVLEWKAVNDFLIPILQLNFVQKTHLNNETEDLNNESRLSTPIQKLVDSCTAAYFRTSWMFGNNKDERIINTENISLCVTFLQQSKQYLSIEEKKKEENDRFKSTKEKESSLALYSPTSVKSAFLAGFFRQTLSLFGSDENNIMKMIKKCTLVETLSKQSDSVFGTEYLLFLVSWSGLHQRPWSFSNVSQTRQIIKEARESIESARLNLGRPISNIESILLLLGEADAEGGLLPGGMLSKAESIFHQALDLIEDGGLEEQEETKLLLKAACHSGLSRIALLDENASSSSSDLLPLQHSQKSLDLLMDLKKSTPEESPCSSRFYLWLHPKAFDLACSFQICASRRLVAESYVRCGKPKEAFSFLQEAIQESPNDYDAAIALGGYLFRSLHYTNNAGNPKPSPKEEKKVQVNLLKAAKLESNRAEAFSVLGVWYELKGDLKRALGCHSKALMLDSCNPVSGRGMLRMKSPDEVKNLCQNATQVSSPMNGWAWKALGQMALNDGDDDLSVTCFQQALRCRDVYNPDNETLGTFYRLPSPDSPTVIYNECSELWSILASSYRRLGKYSASIRAYDFAHTVATVPPSVTCSQGSILLELGLMDQAVEKFEKVLGQSDDLVSHPMASYGRASALLAIAKRDVGQGKFGTALKHLEDAIESLLTNQQELKKQFSCVLRLLGEIYSFGSVLPISVFDGDLKLQLSFMEKGTNAYEETLETLESNPDTNSDDHKLLVATSLCGLGTNLYNQARLIAITQGEGSGVHHTSISDIAQNHSEVNSLLLKSIDNFKKAIDINEFLSPAWCGLGCAFSGIDPLISQHCFCRALELDKISPEPWGNLAMLYTEHELYSQSSESLDALTQVADTPLIWIGRALLLEKKESPIKAADAYSASLQLSKHPSALLGLALATRKCFNKNAIVQDSSYILAAEKMTKTECSDTLSMYLHTTSGESNVGAQLMHSVLLSEEYGDRRPQHKMAELLQQAEKKIAQTNEKLDLMMKNVENRKSEFRSSNTPSCDLMKDLVDVSKSVLSSTTMVENGNSNANSNKDHDTATASLVEGGIEYSKRLVHENPDDPEMWLDLAKAFTSESFALKQKGSIPPKKLHKLMKSHIQAAKVSSKKGYDILHDQLINSQMLTGKRPTTSSSITSTRAKSGEGKKIDDGSSSYCKAVFPAVVDSNTVSEALALVYWLEEIEPQQAEDDQEKTSTSSSLECLQRALLIDPDNTLARNALNRLSKSS